MARVTFRTESVSGKLNDELEIQGLPSSMTVREILRLRVREEVARHNARSAPEARPIDWVRQADIAERAFEHNGLFILVADHQVTELDEVVDLTPDPEIVFIKLIQLVGG